nr:CARDB domain-containing protein [Xenococcus sp. MO_188.B8]
MDLTTKTFQVLPHSAHADDLVDVLFNIANDKDTHVEGVKVKFYLSRNSWISTGDYEIGTYDIHSIDSGAHSGVIRTSLQLPAAPDKFWLDDEDATYYIGALIDKNEAIDLGSSAAYRQFHTHDAIDIKDLLIPDLKGDHFSVSSFTKDADGNIKADINFSLANHGDGYADNFKVDFYLSNETDNRRHPITTDDYFIGSYEGGGLDSGNSTGVTQQTFSLPNGFDEFWEGSGYYSLGMMINNSGDTYESRRFDNNSNQKEGLDYSVNTIFQESWVDLHAVNFDVRQEDVSTYQPGQNLTIDYAIRNDGLGYLSQDFNLDFYVSTDPDINTNDIYIGSQRYVNDLGAGDHARGTVDFILPDNFPTINNGRYYVGFMIDSDNEVPENNEFNNFN